MKPYFRLTPVAAAILPMAGAMALLASGAAQAATYEVEDTGAAPEGIIHTYAADENANTGRIVGYGYNQNAFYDDDDDDDYDDDNRGDDPQDNDNTSDDPDDHDYASLEDLEDIEYFSKAMVADGGAYQVIHAFDQVDSGTGEYSGNTDAYLLAVNSADLAVGYGTAPYRGVYTRQSHVGNDDYDRYIRDFSARAFVYTAAGDFKPLLPPVSEYGGSSAAYAINDSNTVVGYASTYLLADSREWIERCLDGDSYTADWCQNSPSYEEQAYVWHIDDQGNITSEQALPFGVGPLPDDEREDRVYRAAAYGVNNNGIAVGYSYVFHDKDDHDFDRIGRQAVIWDLNSDSDTAFDFTNHDDDDGGYYRSYAQDINDNNTVIGNGYRYINGFARLKAFIYHYEPGNDSEELTEIPTPLTAASANAHDINNQGQVVGEYDYEASSAQLTRRQHGFLYNVESGEFEDLNDLLPCDSPYEVVQANHINEDGTISATALYNTGDVDTEEDWVARGIVLRPVQGGTIEQCDNDDGSQTGDEVTSHRSGGAFFSIFMPLLAWFGWRRRSHKTPA